MTQKALLIAKTWPEPASTAAGRRTIDLLSILSNDFEIHVASAAEVTPFQANLEDMGFTGHTIAVNDDTFDDWIGRLSPDMVIYDRYVMEEQFGWRVRQFAPKAMTLLDTSDLHFLRMARQQAFKKQAPIDLYHDVTIREITAIQRCDLTLLISEFEQQLLVETFLIAANKLLYLPFLAEQPIVRTHNSFQQRQHCMMIGGFKHEPNRDAARWLRDTLWPRIAKKLPNHVQMHVYGGYADHAINQLHSPKHNFYIKGRADDALKTMNQYRLNLAPLRFGAGQKGKIFEGWVSGTPTLSTPIGLESMANEDEVGFSPTIDPEGFAQQCAEFYLNETSWCQAQDNGYRLLSKRFSKNEHMPRFLSIVKTTLSQLNQHRHHDIHSRVLWQNQFKAHEYLSRWITLKNSPDAP